VPAVISLDLPGFPSVVTAMLGPTITYPTGEGRLPTFTTDYFGHRRRAVFRGNRQGDRRRSRAEDSPNPEWPGAGDANANGDSRLGGNICVDTTYDGLERVLTVSNRTTTAPLLTVIAPPTPTTRWARTTSVLYPDTNAATRATMASRQPSPEKGSEPFFLGEDAVECLHGWGATRGRCRKARKGS